MFQKKNRKKDRTSPIAGLKKALLQEKRFYRKHKVISVILAALFLWAIIWVSQVAVERCHFYQVEKTMDKISKDIRSNFNVISEKKDRSCGKRNEAFGERRGGCSISYSYQIILSDNKTVERIDELVNARKDTTAISFDETAQSSKGFRKNYSFRENGREQYYSSYRLNGIDDPACEIVYTLPSPPSAKRALSVNFSCASSKSAHLPYFPVQE